MNPDVIIFAVWTAGFLGIVGAGWWILGRTTSVGIDPPRQEDRDDKTWELNLAEHHHYQEWT